MESTKLSALMVLSMLALSSSPVALAWEKAEPECNSCQTGSTGGAAPSAGGVTLPPVTLPPVAVPKLPSLPRPSLPIPPVLGTPVTVPPVLGGGNPVTVPPVLGGGNPVTVPPVLGGGNPVTVPPVTGLPPVTLPPVLGGGSPSSSSSPKSPRVRHGGRKACPPPPTPTPSPPASDTCPIDALKLGACVDVLGNEVHVGDANVQCCPLVKGIAGLSAAACLCTAIKAKVLDISVYVPIALKVLVNCGCAVPPGYTCA
ncbi:hypothetical protein ACP4OV_026159 [Aristida adscensionis]